MPPPLSTELSESSDFWEEVYNTATEINEQSLQELCPSTSELKLLVDQYNEEKLIGQGTLKEVYQCYDQRVKRYVALARPKAGLDIALHELFVHEAWLTSSLSHPNIIKIYDINIDNSEAPYFTMDLKGNRTLRDFLAEDHSLEARLEVFLKVCDAISYAHSMQVIHLDLKPENIQCDNFGEVLVCDWGLGKNLTLDPDFDVICQNPLYGSENETLYGDLKGTPGFMAPEQATPGAEKTAQTDIFSLGCLLYFTLNAQAPFTGDRQKIITDTINAQYKTLSQLPSRYKGAKSISAVVKKALQKRPEDRYTSVEALKEDVYKYLAGYITLAEKPSLIRKAYLFTNRHKFRLAMTSLSMLIIFALADLAQRSLSETKSYLSLAETLRNKVNNSVLEKQLFDEATSVLNKEMAHEAVKHSMSIFTDFMDSTDPLKDLWELELVLNSAIQRYPNNQAARLLLNRFAIIKMNYAYVKDSEIFEPNDIRSKIAHLLPHYSYTENARPSLEELALTFKRMKSLSANRNDHGLLRRIIDHTLWYDWHTRINKEHYEPVIIEAIYTFNHISYEQIGIPKFNVTFTPTEKKLEIESSRNLFLRRENKDSLIHYLDLDICKISCKKKFNLFHLQGANIKVLDLSSSADIEITAPIHIKGLEKIILGPKPQNTYGIMSRVKSDRPYEITRKTD